MARAGQIKSLEALDWPSLIRPGELVVWAQASAEPVSLTQSLVAARAAVGGFRAFVGISYGASVDLAHTDWISFSSYCATGVNLKLGKALDILPIPYGQISSVLGREAPVVLLSLAPGADADHYSFGAAGDYIADLLKHARLVIAEINSEAPKTGQGVDIGRDQIDIIIPLSHPPAPAFPARIGDAERRIGAHIAEWVEDGSTIQIGLGAIPAAVLKALGHHRDLGIHSGMITDEVADLARSGVITNSRKSRDSGMSVTGLFSGTQRLMDWAAGNTSVVSRPTSYTHDPNILRSLDRLVAINSALEVDLTGQVNAEAVGGRYLGAVGGAGAFLRGAAEARGGLPIIALTSMANGRSRIVASLNGPVSTARCDIGLVVTEHGVADLRGASIRQRQERLISIADPSFRQILLDQLSSPSH